MLNKSDQRAAIQRLRLLKRLQKGPISTIEARHELDILGVAPRVHELRHEQGLNIVTHWIDQVNPGGKNHRIAQYVLLPGKFRKRGAAND